MPFKSQKQRRWAYANKDKPGVAKLIKHSKGKPIAKKKAVKRGRA